MNRSYSAALRHATEKSIWSLKNVVDCIPDDMWSDIYCGTPLYKHVYHTLHSLDRCYINPFVYTEPVFHTEGLNDLNLPGGAFLSREILKTYADQVEIKIIRYLDELTDDQLHEKSENSELTRFELIIGQHRHLDMHIGMLMGFVIAKQGRWPKVLGLIDKIEERRQCEFD